MSKFSRREAELVRATVDETLRAVAAGEVQPSTAAARKWPPLPVLLVLLACFLIAAAECTWVWQSSHTVSTSTFSCSSTGVPGEVGLSGVLSVGARWSAGAGVVMAYGPQVLYATTDSGGYYSVKVKQTKARTAQLLEVLLPSKTGMVRATAELPTATCDGDDQ